MSKHSPVSKIIRKTSLTVQSTDRVSTVYQLMKNHALPHVTVVEQSRIVGIISCKSLKQLGFGADFDGHDGIEAGTFDMLQANQVMERNIPKITLPANVGDVAELMATRAFVALPAVADGHPIGIVDINDVVLFLLNG